MVKSFFLIASILFSGFGLSQSLSDSTLHADPAVRVLKHDYFKKFKHKPAHLQLHPVYLNPEENDHREYIYCAENIYVKPLYLYDPKADSGTRDRITRKERPVNRRFRKVQSDTTFLALETQIEQMLFTQRQHCNSEWIKVVDVEFTLNTDSLVSLEFMYRHFELPAAEQRQMAEYRTALEEAIEAKERERINAEKRSNRSRLRLRKRLPKRMVVDDRPYMPVVQIESLRMPEYDVNPPELCDSILFPEKNNYLSNGYSSWKAVKPCYDFDKCKPVDFRDSVQYTSLVLNPHTLRPLDPEVLLGENFRTIVYEEMMALYENLGKKSENQFNEYHYKPELKRHFMWGLDRENLIIYYGNEGEFVAYQKHLIPLTRFLE